MPRPSKRFAAPEYLSTLLITELSGRLALRGVRWAEISLVDPTDGPLRSLLSEARASVYKSYRVFEKELGA